MKTFCHYVLLATTCFSLMGYCPGGEGLCLTQHDDTKKSNSSHGVNAHEDSEHSQLPSVHKYHQVDSVLQCCQTPSKESSDCARIFVLPNKIKTFRSSLTATFSPQITISCFQLLEKNFISEIFNSTNPTLASLRTVILLA